MADISQQLVQQVETAIAEKTPLSITGGGSKAFYGRRAKGEPMSISSHQGIVNYEPTELVITARAGTRLEEIESILEENNQMIPFEPPYFGPDATLGGTIACNFSGPRRAYAGAARDFVLGTKIINGKAELLSFGGEVMKNVAGYDVSRLMCGAMGTLGVLMEISFKVLPKAENELTLRLEASQTTAIEQMNQWATQPNPISATAFSDGCLTVRLSGAENAVKAAKHNIGGELLSNAEYFWESLREQRLPVFAENKNKTVWRLSVPSTTQPLSLSGQWLIEWGGAQRWLVTDEEPSRIRELVSNVGGHAVLFKGGDREGDIFHPLSDGLLKLHENLKQAFDPHHIFNPGRMYPNL